MRVKSGSKKLSFLPDLYQEVKEDASFLAHFKRLQILRHYFYF